MISLEALIAICAEAVPKVARGVLIAWRKRLSDEERELLIAAAECPEFTIIQVDQPPYRVILVGSKPVPPGEANDIAVQAKYDDAFRSLCKRGVVEHISGDLFRLTADGLQKARKLAGPG